MINRVAILFHLRFIAVTYLCCVMGVSSCETLHDVESSGKTRSISPDPTDLSNSINHHIAIDDTKNIHLVWQDTKKKVTYQRTADLGKTWTAPVVLSKGSTTYNSIQPRVFFFNGTISVFWFNKGVFLCQSIDSGKSWRAPLRVISGIAANRYSLHSMDGVVYIAYSNLDGIFISISEDFGLNWSEANQIHPDAGESRVTSLPSIATSNGIIHLIWSLLDSKNLNPGGMMRGELYYTRSYNHGDDWQDAKILNINKGRSDHEIVYSILYPSIVATNNSLLIAFEENGLGVIVSSDRGDSWSPRISLSEAPVQNLYLKPSIQSGTQIFWIDKRHEKQDWWGHIPLHEMFTWDNGPHWVNNDLYHSTIKNGVLDDEQRLTLSGSYVERHANSISCEVVGDTVVVFWSGKREVGKFLSDSKTPTEIFYRSLNTKQ